MPRLARFSAHYPLEEEEINTANCKCRRSVKQPPVSFRGCISWSNGANDWETPSRQKSPPTVPPTPVAGQADVGILANVNERR